MLVDRVKTHDSNQWFDPSRDSVQVLEQYNSYFADDNRVGRATSLYVTGLNKHSRNRWYRYRHSEGVAIYRGKSGLYGTRRGAKGGYTSGMPWYQLEHDQKFKEITEGIFGEITMKTVYPISDFYNIATENEIPGQLRAAMRSANPRKFVEQAFGKTRYRKDLLKAIAGAHPSVISIARDFRGLVPIDWIVTFLNQSTIEHNLRMPFRFSSFQSIRPYLFNLDPRDYRRLLLNEPFSIAQQRFVQDIAGNRVVQPAAVEAKSWRALHDNLWDNAYGRARINRVALMRDVWGAPTTLRDPAIKLNELATKLNGAVVGPYRLVSPESTETLMEWGTFMRNCIGGYGYQAQRGDTTLGGVYEGDKLIANYEISGLTLRQLLGKFNQSLATDARNTLEEFFRTQGVDTKTYWGK